MSSLILDPFVLAYPSESSTNIEQIEDYIFRLLDWDKIINESQIDILISDKTSEILVLEDNFPSWGNLKSIFDKFNIEFIQPKDVITVINKILKLKSIQELGIDEILFDNVIIDDENIHRRPIRYFEEFKRILMFICLYEKLGHKHFLLSKDEINDVIYVSGEIYEIDKEIDISISTPTVLALQIEVVVTFDEFLRRINPIQYWEESKDIVDYEEAIKISVFQRTGKLQGCYWKFGSLFLETARDLGFLTNPKKIKVLIKAIVDTVLEENLRNIHHLRIGPGGNDPQVTRGEDKAWRRDIDYEYHLHYWETKNGFEFGSVVVHNDMTIPV